MTALVATFYRHPTGDTPGAELLRLWHDNAVAHFFLEVRVEERLYDFGVTWIRQDSGGRTRTVSRLQLFDDAWGALAAIPEFFRDLADSECISPDGFAELLVAHGFREKAQEI